MHWDRLFEDLEGQLASEWEAERAALAAESERLRIARLDLRSRMTRLCAAGADVTIELANGRRVPLALQTSGADWVIGGSRVAEGAHVAAVSVLVPLHGIAAVTVDHGALLASLEDEPAPESSLRARMTLGFLLRDLARRRVPVHLSTRVGDDIHGTIDRAAADHLDLAVHDAGEARRTDAVQGFRVIPFSALVAARLPGGQLR